MVQGYSSAPQPGTTPEDATDERIRFLREELARVTRERDEAIASERRLWGAFAVMSAAANRASGTIRMTVQAIEDVPQDIYDEALVQQNLVGKAIRNAWKQAGIAVEGD